MLAEGGAVKGQTGFQGFRLGSKGLLHEAGLLIGFHQGRFNGGDHQGMGRDALDLGQFL